MLSNNKINKENNRREIGESSLRNYSKPIPSAARYSGMQNNVNNIGSVIWTLTLKKDHGIPKRTIISWITCLSIMVSRNGPKLLKYSRGELKMHWKIVILSSLKECAKITQPSIMSYSLSKCSWKDWRIDKTVQIQIEDQSGVSIRTESEKLKILQWL